MSNAPSRFHREYKQNAISTSDQGKLILMMYDGAIKNLQLAKESMKSENISNKGMHIQKSHDIVNELSLALDMNKGGQVAARLEQLYQYVLSQLTLANIKRMDLKPIDEALGVLNTLQSAWQQIILKAQTPKTPKAKEKFAAQC
tara:strand:- start:3477 stop:3908 length:432 start_codon:yes stop_codon:yes gene_type:complete